MVSSKPDQRGARGEDAEAFLKAQTAASVLTEKVDGSNQAGNNLTPARCLHLAAPAGLPGKGSEPKYFGAQCDQRRGQQLWRQSKKTKSENYKEKEEE